MRAAVEDRGKALSSPVADEGGVALRLWQSAKQWTVMPEIALDELWKAVALARKELGIARKEDR